MFWCVFRPRVGIPLSSLIWSVSDKDTMSMSILSRAQVECAWALCRKLEINLHNRGNLHQTETGGSKLHRQALTVSLIYRRTHVWATSVSNSKAPPVSTSTVWVYVFYGTFTYCPSCIHQSSPLDLLSSWLLRSTASRSSFPARLNTTNQQFASVTCASLDSRYFSRACSAAHSIPQNSMGDQQQCIRKNTCLQLRQTPTTAYPQPLHGSHNALLYSALENSALDWFHCAPLICTTVVERRIKAISHIVLSLFVFVLAAMISSNAFNWIVTQSNQVHRCWTLKKNCSNYAYISESRIGNDYACRLIQSILGKFRLFTI